MAKITKPARRDAAANPRSRAAKRATSPSINLDKSLKETTRTSDTTPILGPNHQSGISKKKKHKQITRGQRVRQEKGLARAEAVSAQMENKLADAKTRMKRIQGRKALWEDVNATVEDETRKTIRGPGRFVVLADGEDAADEAEGVQPYHGDTEMKVIDGVQVPASASGSTMTIAQKTDPAKTSTNGDQTDLIT